MFMENMLKIVNTDVGGHQIPHLDTNISIIGAEIINYLIIYHAAHEGYRARRSI
jgi:hypothetical protein